MTAHKAIRDSYASTVKQRNATYKSRLSLWRRQPVITRTERPTNISTARRLGYRAVNGVVIARVRLAKGRRTRPRPKIGRKPGRNLKKVSFGKSHGWLAQQKAAKRFPNLVPRNAYFVGEDGTNVYYEVILTPCAC